MMRARGKLVVGGHTRQLHLRNFPGFQKLLESSENRRLPYARTILPRAFRDRLSRERQILLHQHAQHCAPLPGLIIHILQTKAVDIWKSILIF